MRVLKGRVLRQVVVKGPKAGQILRSKITFGKERIAREQSVAMGQILVNAKRSLIGKIAVGAQVQVVVGVRSGSHSRLRMHSHHAASGKVGQRHVRQHPGGNGVDFAIGDSIIRQRGCEERQDWKGWWEATGCNWDWRA